MSNTVVKLSPPPKIVLQYQPSPTLSCWVVAGDEWWQCDVNP